MYGFLMDDYVHLPSDHPATQSEVTRSCWSIFEGCVCAHNKDHDWYHECDDPDCTNFWTDEESQKWKRDQSLDRHQRSDR